MEGDQSQQVYYLVELLPMSNINKDIILLGMCSGKLCETVLTQLTWLT